MRMAPHAVVIEPSQGLYQEFSRSIMAIFREITPLVEQLSVDEAFLDVTGSMRRLGSPREIGELIRRRMHEELGLPASVGIARNKFVAKIASTRAKPDGLLLIAPARTVEFLHTLPVRALWGVGAKTAQSLQESGITTVAQLAALTEKSLQRRYGASGTHLFALAHGMDDRPVEVTREEKSIGSEETFAVDVFDTEVLRREILRLAHRVSARLRASGKEAGTVVLKLRYADFTTLSRSKRIDYPTSATGVIAKTAHALLQGLGERPQAVRLVGVRAEKLESSAGGYQLSIDAQEDNWRQAEQAVDRIRERFPAGALRPASLVRPLHGNVPDGHRSDPGSIGTEAG